MKFPRIFLRRFSSSNFFARGLSLMNLPATSDFPRCRYLSADFFCTFSSADFHPRIFASVYFRACTVDSIRVGRRRLVPSNGRLSKRGRATIGHHHLAVDHNYQPCIRANDFPSLAGRPGGFSGDSGSGFARSFPMTRATSGGHARALTRRGRPPVFGVGTTLNPLSGSNEK